MQIRSPNFDLLMELLIDESILAGIIMMMPNMDPIGHSQFRQSIIEKDKKKTYS